MPTPTGGSIFSLISASGNYQVDSLLAGTRWGAGGRAAVSFSFPGASSVWSTDAASGYGPSSGAGEPWNGFAALTALQRQGARAALQSWSSIANVTFDEVAETAATVGDIRFGFTSSVVAGSAAHAYMPGGSFNPATGIGTAFANSGDIWIASSAAPTFNPAVGSSDFGTLLHEVGHALGLKHPFEPDGAFGTLPPGENSTQFSVMSYTNHPHSLFRDVQAIPGGFSWTYFHVQPSTPMLYDILALQYLYGPNLGARTGNDTYTYSPTTPFLATIWDAGGTDTISVANFSESCTIDLRAGRFSSIRILSDPLPPGASDSTFATYDGTDNLAIAFGVVIENAVGGGGADFLFGNAANNNLNGGPNADVMEGGAGNDVYVVDRIGDVVSEVAGEGSDTIRSSVSLALPVNVESLALLGSAGIAGTGNSGANTITGNSGNNALNGAGGVDTVSYASAPGPAGVVVNLLSGQATGWGTDTLLNFENVAGSNFADRITGSAGSNTIEGRGGNDTLDGGAGTDTASYAGAVAAVVVSLAASGAQSTGGAGTDTLANFENLIGSAHHDSLTGTSGNNTIEGRAGNDTLDGAAGVDTVSYGVAASGVTISLAQQGVAQNTGGAGIDTLFGFENITGSVWNDVLTGGAGNNVMVGGPGNDTLDGGGGVDTVNYASAASGVSVNLSFGQATGGAGSDVLTGFESVIGTPHADTLVGNAGNNSLNGGAGFDVLRGEAGNDVLVYDALDFEAHGGAGTDTLTVPGSGVILFLPGVAGVSLVDIERINLTGTGNNALVLTVNDVLRLSNSADDLLVMGNAGDEVVAGTGWSHGTDETIGAQIYARYTQGLATLLVDTDIALTFG